jgi:acyl-CoA thioesterase-2
VTAELAARDTAPEWGPTIPDSLPSPESLPSTRDTAKREGWEDYAAGPLEFRRVNASWPPPPEDQQRPHREWLRPRAALPPDPKLHTAALVFASQFYPQWAFEWRAGRDFRRDRFAILAHSVWLHEPARWDDWWLVDTHSDASSGGRALAHRRIFARDGRLLASATHTASV